VYLTISFISYVSILKHLYFMYETWFVIM
jgi:hypothetical protein